MVWWLLFSGICLLIFCSGVILLIVCGIRYLSKRFIQALRNRSLTLPEERYAREEITRAPLEPVESDSSLAFDS